MLIAEGLWPIDLAASGRIQARCRRLTLFLLLLLLLPQLLLLLLLLPPPQQLLLLLLLLPLLRCCGCFLGYLASPRRACLVVWLYDWLVGWLVLSAAAARLLLPLLGLRYARKLACFARSTLPFPALPSLPSLSLPSFPFPSLPCSSLPSLPFPSLVYLFACQTPEDIARMVFMGANRINMGTALMLANGCVKADSCQNDDCPVGIATQRMDLREKFPGRPENVVGTHVTCT